MSENRKRPDAVALTDLFLQNLTKMKDPAKGKVRRDIYDLHQRGLILRATPQGTLTWYGSYQIRGSGRPSMERLGSYPSIGLAEARTLVTRARDLARDGIDPKIVRAEQVAAKEAERSQRTDDQERNLFSAVLAAYLERKAKNKSIGETKRTFDLYFADWLDLDIRTIKRADIEAKLKKIAARQITGKDRKKLGGPVARETAMRQVRALMRWHELAETDLSRYRAPIFRELTELSVKDLERDHFLSDAEIAGLWDATADWKNLSDGSQFSAIIRLLLLSGQRKSEVANLQRTEIDEHGVWWLPRARAKNRDLHALPLTQTMREIIDAQPIFVAVENGKRKDTPWVFSNTGRSGFSGFSRAKEVLDIAMLAAMRKRATERGEDASKVVLRPWRIHDLRRTCRTLGQRINVNDVHMERLLGHKQQGIQGTYAKHMYIEEKRLALAKIEAEIMRIVDGEPLARVVQISSAKRGRKGRV